MNAHCLHIVLRCIEAFLAGSALVLWVGVILLAGRAYLKDRAFRKTHNGLSSTEVGILKAFRRL